VALARFDAGDLPASARIFVTTLPRLLALDLGTMPPHYEAASYLREKRSLTARITKYSLGEDLAKRLDDLAVRVLEPGVDANQRGQNLLDAKTRIKKAREALDAGLLGADDPHFQGEGEALRGVELSEDTRRGQLAELGATTPADTAKKLKVDLLIYGRIEAVGDYLAITIRGYDSNLGRDLFSWKDYASPNDPDPLARNLAMRISAEIAARPYASVDIALDPSAATLSLDGTSLEPGIRRLFFFEPGQHRLVASAPGRKTVETSLGLAPGEAQTLSLRLPVEELGGVSVQSDPAGLEIFRDGLPVGRAPLVVALDSERSIISAADSGGARVQAVVTPMEKGSILLAPGKLERDGGKKLTEGRRAFYDSLGFVVLSLPPLSLAYGLNTLYTDAANAGGSGLVAASEASTVALVVLAVVSLGLTVNAVLRFLGYLSTAR
jgi:hypothetical protein